VGEPVDPATYRARYEEMLHREGVPFWPDAAWRDVVFGASMVAVVVLLAVIVGPPDLGRPPDPSLLQADPRPDWYFLWYFAVLAFTPKHLETIVIVLGPLLFGAILLLLPISNKGERSVRRRPWAWLLVIFIWTTIASFWVAAQRADWSPNFAATPLPASVVRSTEPAVVRGATLFYQRGCEFCHSIDGNGGRKGPELSQVGSRMTEDQLEARITNGGPNMPAFAKSLPPEEVQMIVQFLKTRR
jgi:ubiquinol-cytochrome c reductase cytochrome b subunit